MKQLIKEFLNSKFTITQFCKDKNINIQKFKEELKAKGYIIQKSATPNIIRYLHLVIKDYKSGKYSIAQLSKKYNIAPSTISNNLKKLNIKIINKQNVIKFDEDVFNIIDTEEKAYWLGFIFADGYVSLKNGFELSLSIHDYSHLIKFNRFMKHQDPNHVKIGSASYNKQRCRWSVKNPNLAKSLMRLGCVPRKSLILKFPKIEIFQNKSLIRHFIRGYFDGDGCFGYAYNYNKTRLYCRLTILGTKEFLETLMQVSNINGTLRCRKKIWVLSFTKINSINFAKYIYKDCNIYLDRKYQRYNLFINKFNNAVPFSNLGDY